MRRFRIKVVSDPIVGSDRFQPQERLFGCLWFVALQRYTGHFNRETGPVFAPIWCDTKEEALECINTRQQRIDANKKSKPVISYLDVR